MNNGVRALLLTAFASGAVVGQKWRDCLSRDLVDEEPVRTDPADQ
ncbi:hypothetical protein M728_005746 (plasmid) [Ensifer sp. WSM1721]